MMKSILFNLGLAFEGVMANKFRAILTALGIVFGVAAVIAMLAIGKGAEQAILDQMRLIGTNNIVITAKVDDGELNTEEGESESRDADKRELYSPGLNLADLAAIQANIPSVKFTSPEFIMQQQILRGKKAKKGYAVGITNDYFKIQGLGLKKGTFFHPTQFEKGSPVCILGSDVENRFFPDKDPVGEYIKCGNTWLKIVGVLKKRQASSKDLENLGIRNPNQDIYIPISTALIRYENRNIIDRGDLGNKQEEQSNYHQIDKATVHVEDAAFLRNTAGLISRMLKRRHNENLDFEIEVPELLIQQQQKTQETFNLVLAIIAGISLLVGGIGIMNIMLASVMERIKEIGIRRSLGATRKDIILQFLLEAILISVFGGLLGIALGIASSEIVARSANIPTTIDIWALALSFSVAVGIGLIFGLLPAEKAAQQDPIKSLRTD